MNFKVFKFSNGKFLKDIGSVTNNGCTIRITDSLHDAYHFNQILGVDGLFNANQSEFKYLNGDFHDVEVRVKE